MTNFVRKIDGKAMESLSNLAQSRHDNWWKQLLLAWKPSGQGLGLRMGIRENTIDFYRDGWRVAHVGFSQAAASKPPVPHMSTHIKYIAHDSQDDKSVKFIASEENGNLHYEGDTVSIQQIINNIDSRMAKIRAKIYPRKGLEKLGVDKIVSKNTTVIDLEMGMQVDQKIALKYAKKDKPLGAPRIDLVSLEQSSSGANVVFWEAKTLDDTRLRARGEAEVIRQLNAYRDYLSDPERRENIRKAYKATCNYLVELNKMRPEKAELDKLIMNVAANEIELNVDISPRLIIFGKRNDKTAYHDESWKPHAERIGREKIWATYAVNAEEIHLASAMQPISA